MGMYWKLIADLEEETTAYAAAAGALQTSPYTPSEDAKLTGLRLVNANTAATSLLNGLQVKLTCTTFKPNSIEVFMNGNGLNTAPAINVPAIDYPVSQDVKAGVPITIESRNINASAVTVAVALMGRFES